MIDLHCHILPFVDDGADNAAVACAMAEYTLLSGVGTIVATPHCNLRGARGNYRSEASANGLAMFRALLRQHRIPLRVLPGAEVFAHMTGFPELLRDKRLPTLNNSRYLLTEFNFTSSGETMTHLLELISAQGYVPVVAHPERYAAVQEDHDLAAYWFSRGYLLQLNKGSILKRLGKEAYHTALFLLRSGLVDVIASDGHDMELRTPGFRSLLPTLNTLCPLKYCQILLQSNPEKIIRDLPVRHKVR